MKIRPSIRGFYAKNYLFATVLSIILVFAGAYMILLTREIMVSALLILAGIGIVAIGIAHSIVNSKTTYLELDDKQIVYDSGIFSHHRITAPISMVTDSTIKRTFFERIVGIADLHVNTSGTATVEILANDFDHEEVFEIHEKLNKMIHSRHAKTEPEKKR